MAQERSERGSSRCARNDGIGHLARSIYHGIYSEGWGIGREHLKVRRVEGQEMAKTAKLFKNGRSQAVRLPTEFRFAGTEVFIRKDEETGDVILSRWPGSWEEFFRFRDNAMHADPRAFEEFLAERRDEAPEKRELFG